MKNLICTHKKLSIALLMSVILVFVFAPLVFAWSFNGYEFKWDAGFSGGSILFRYNLTANYHWLASGRLSPNPANFNTWLYTYAQNGWEGRYPVVGAVMGENYRICVGASDTNPGSVDLYDHPNNRCFRVWRNTSSTVSSVEIFNISGTIVDVSGQPLAGVSINDGAGHTVTTDSNGYYRLVNLDHNTYTLTPSKSGYTFSPASLSATGGPAYNVTGQNFTALPNRTITPSAGANGSITPNTPQTVNYGGSRTFTIAANTGYHIANVTVDGASQGAIGSYTFSNVTTDHTIAATFAINTFTITPSAGANGSITPNTPQTVNYGSASTFTIIPNLGYHVTNVVGWYNASCVKGWEPGIL